MRFLADECVYRLTIELVRVLGHDILPARAAGLAECTDDEVVAAAAAQARILLTNDMHLSNILRFPPQRYCGIIVLRIRPRVQGQVHSVLERFLSTADQEAMHGRLVIVDRNKYRLR